jgi:hypothetical protein
MYVKPFQILLHSEGNLLFTYQTTHGFIKVRGPIRKEVRGYKLNSCQLISMKRL